MRITAYKSKDEAFFISLAVEKKNGSLPLYAWCSRHCIGIRLYKLTLELEFRWE